MRILLMWPSNDPHTSILIERLQSAGHRIVYWVGEKPIEHLNPAGCIFHDHYDAWDARRAEALLDADVAPVDPKLIESMYATESLILTMMNKRYDGAPVDERKHIYYTMLSYWSYVLSTLKPDAVIYNTVPHSIYSNIVYDLARRAGVRTLTFEETWVAGRLMFYTDFWKGSDVLRASLAKILKRGVKPSDLHQEVREYYEHQSNPRSEKTPWYMAKQRAIGRGVGLWTHRARIALRSPQLVLSRAIKLIARSVRANLQSEYEALAQSVDFSRPYVYFPLNFQPERTTSPQGGIFHDQILAAETIAKAVPDGWELCIKEHPSQWWLRGKTRYSSARYPGYYKRLASIPRARLVPIHTDTFALTDSARAVATITGTAGWEALIRGKHALVFGIPWYRDCPGVIPVRSVDECKEALARLVSTPRVKEADVRAYLAAFGETTTRAHLSEEEGVLPQISQEESMQVIAEKLIAELAR